MWNSCGNRRRMLSDAKPWNRLVQPSELAKVPCASLASVLGDHRVAVVADPVGDPRLRLTRRKRDRHERCAQNRARGIVDGSRYSRRAELVSPRRVANRCYQPGRPGARRSCAGVVNIARHVTAAPLRRERSAGTATENWPAHSGRYVQLSRDRVLPQDTALKGAAAGGKSTPETLTTACHAASWLARLWRCGWRIASIGPVNFP